MPEDNEPKVKITAKPKPTPKARGRPPGTGRNQTKKMISPRLRLELRLITHMIYIKSVFN